jgi:hypothetical protein
MYIYYKPTKRLGSGAEDAKEIMRHPFFASIDWVKLAKREIQAPFKPKINSADDYKNIDPIFLNEEVKDTPSEPLLDKKAANFDGFTFNSDKISVEMNQIHHKL